MQQDFFARTGAIRISGQSKLNLTHVKMPRESPRDKVKCISIKFINETWHAKQWEQLQTRHVTSLKLLYDILKNDGKPTLRGPLSSVMVHGWRKFKRVHEQENKSIECIVFLFLFDKSLSPWKPKLSKTGWLPNITYV